MKELVLQIHNSYSIFYLFDIPENYLNTMFIVESSYEDLENIETGKIKGEKNHELH